MKDIEQTLREVMAMLQKGPAEEDRARELLKNAGRAIQQKIDDLCHAVEALDHAGRRLQAHRRAIADLKRGAALLGVSVDKKDEP